MHTNRRNLQRKDTPRSLGREETCSDALQAADARVSTRVVCEFHAQISTSRFYPGISSSNLPAIESGWTPGAIASSEVDSEEGEGSLDKASSARGLPPASRATRVVGSFDHAVLPMPPVSKPPFLIYDYGHVLMLIMV